MLVHDGDGQAAGFEGIWHDVTERQRLHEQAIQAKRLEAVRQVVIPLEAVAGAGVRRRWWRLWSGPRLVLRAADLQAFEAVTGEGGLRLAHPAELVLRLRRSDRLVAEEFSAELALAVAELAASRSLDRALPADDSERSQDLPRPNQDLPPNTDDHS